MTITIYTNYLIMTYNIVFTGTKEELAHALDEGPVLVSTTDGTQVLINALLTPYFFKIGGCSKGGGINGRRSS